MKKQTRNFLYVVGLVLLALFLYQYIAGSGISDSNDLNYTEFRSQVQDKKIKDVTIEGQTITGTTKEGAKFTTTIPDDTTESIANQLRDQGASITVEEPGQGWGVTLIFWLPIILIAGLWFYLQYKRSNMMGGGMTQFQDDNATQYDKEEAPDVTFDDIAGYSQPKKETEQIIDFLKDPKKYKEKGGQVPKGVMMVGPPGTGKTLMARAVAGEAGVPFIATTGSDFMEMFVGVGASRIRSLFETAKEQAPAIIFIDEIDSIGRKRGAGIGGGHDEREQTLNQMLNELDGFDPYSGVVVMAATNRPDILDPALMRPGRFDRKVTFGKPTVKEREGILEKHSEDVDVADDIDLESIARSTPGFTGADLENVLNEAALITAKEEQDKIDQDVIEQALDKVMLGLKREDMVISDDEKEILARHEAGHAATSFYLDQENLVQKVTIVPRGRSLGVTQQVPLEEKQIHTRESLMTRLAVMMGGRVAEDLWSGSVTNGAQDDLQRATKLARKMVLQWGMGEHDTLNNVAFDTEEQDVFLGEDIASNREYSEETAQKIDEEIQAVLNEANERAREILTKHQDKIEELVNELIEDEVLSQEEIAATLNDDDAEE